MNQYEVVTDIEQKSIIDWVNENWKSFIYNENNGGFYIITDMIHDIYKNEVICDIIKTIEERIIEKENLQSARKPIYLEDFVYYMNEGTKLHLHKDENDINGYQIRFNVCIQKPIKGGIPCYSGKKINIEEKCYIICRAGLDYHTGGLIFGEKPKIVLSFGFSIDEKNVHLYTNRF